MQNRKTDENARRAALLRLTRLNEESTTKPTESLTPDRRGSPVVAALEGVVEPLGVLKQLELLRIDRAPGG